MTIFLEVAKAVIKDTVNNIIIESEKANKASWSLYPRDVGLSQKKCEELRKLLAKLALLKDNTDDHHTHDDVISLVFRYQDTINSLRSPDHSEDATEGGLKCLLASLLSIYHEIERRLLLNLPFEADPFSQFRFTIALFSAKKIVNSNLSGIRPQEFFATGRHFTSEQETLVQSALHKCTGAVKLLDGLAAAAQAVVGAAADSEFNYPTLRKQLVLHHFSVLRKQHAALCESFPLGSFLHPDKQLLDQCLKEAHVSLLLDRDPSFGFEDLGEVPSLITTRGSAGEAASLEGPAEPNPQSSISSTGTMLLQLGAGDFGGSSAEPPRIVTDPPEKSGAMRPANEADTLAEQASSSSGTEPPPPSTTAPAPVVQEPPAKGGRKAKTAGGGGTGTSAVTMRH